MTLVVTETFKDWDGIMVEKGTVAEDLVDLGWYEGVRFWNLISKGRVIAASPFMPPVELINDMGEGNA